MLTLAIVAIIATGATALGLLERRAQSRFAENSVALGQLNNRLATLRSESQELSNRLAQVTGSFQEPTETEIARLRKEVTALRRAREAIERRQHARPPTATVQAEPNPNGDSAWEEAQLEKVIAAKESDARLLSLAVSQYPFRHGGQFPTNFHQVTELLTNSAQYANWTGTNEFEIVYHGSRNDWTNIPWAAVAVIRECQPWKGRSGKWARLYGMGNGLSQVVESDDNFEAWETQHLIPP